MSKPPFSYFGGKIGMAQRIVDVMPPHRVYLEPFFGSGAVLFAKPDPSSDGTDGRLLDVGGPHHTHAARSRPTGAAAVIGLRLYCWVRSWLIELDRRAS